MSIGLYYPRNLAMENCQREGSVLPGSAATFIGSGQSNCLESLLCAANSKSSSAFYGCVVDSCAANAKEMTAVLQCRFRVAVEPGGACQKACAGGGAGCSQCIQTECKDSIAVCSAAKCQ